MPVRMHRASAPAISATDITARQPTTHRAVRTLIPQHRVCPRCESPKDPLASWIRLAAHWLR